jgi:GDSL-like lipase/acylhydrolase family protein
MATTPSTLSILTDGDTFTISVGGVSLFSDSGLSTPITFPQTISADTTWYAANLTKPGLRQIGVKVTTPDGTTVIVPTVKSLPATVDAAEGTVSYSSPSAGGGGSTTPTTSTVSGPPTSGPFVSGNTAVDDSGRWWVCEIAGSPGYWSPAAGETFDPFAARHMARLIQKLTAGVEDAVIVITGDSTSNDTTDWFYIWLQAVGAMFPAYTITHALFTDGTFVYAAPTTVQTGTGPRTLTVYNASVGGMSTAYGVTHFAAEFTTTPLDLAIVNYGHNNTASTFTADYTALTALITAAYPAAGVICSGQNPRTDTTANTDLQYVRMAALRLLANRAGFGYVDVMQAFLNVATWASTLINADGIHPKTPEGFNLWRDEWLRYVSQARRVRDSSPTSIEPYNGYSGDEITVGQSTLQRIAGCNSTTQALGSSGTMRLTYFTAYRSETVTTIEAETGATAAAATPTLCRMGLYSVAANGDIALLSGCANDTTLFAGTGTVYNRALGASQALVLGKRYAVGVLVVTGAALPTFLGFSFGGSAAHLTRSPRKTAAVTGLSDLPASTVSGSLATSGSLLYGVVAP